MTAVHLDMTNPILKAGLADIRQVLGELPYSGLVPYIDPEPGLADIANWLRQFGKELARVAAQNEIDSREAANLRADRDALRRLLGTEVSS